ncbi:MAG TPA: fatty acid CoA ligase family protein [Opitutaceae bacterium]|nr:fatty acid CoA ligase family protein [Opitutaceae bacterium]
MPETANIARHLALMAARAPRQAALKIPRGRATAGGIDYLTLDFAGLAAETAAWQKRLVTRGVRPGDRALVMVRPGLPLIASVFALFALGAVPVIIDPGMGRKNFLACVTRSRPRVLVGVPLAQFFSRIFRAPFRSVQLRVAASAKLTARLAAPDGAALAPEIGNAAATDLAAILFTSGSTGAPKGVCYRHGMFEAQIRLIREAYGIEPGEVDLPLLPVFALFNPALGLTTIVPEIDPRRPAAADPAAIVQAIRQENVTNSFGSPTLWRKIGGYCMAEKIALPSLRRVLCAGAPVPADLWQNFRTWLPQGRLHSPYGATEALPVSTVSAEEIDPASVRGACVGRPLAGIEARIIVLTDAPIATLEAARPVPSGETGEIIVRGPVVTKTYDALPEATAAAKIPAADGAIWHRMGDCGYLDPAGRLWFCGRKAERVETAAGPMFTEPCEQVFRAHPRVARCALIGLGSRGAQRPAIVIEAKPKNPGEARTWAGQLRVLARQHPHTATISLFYFHPNFPVDVRHNAKIHRLALAQWAATAKGFEADR